MALSQEELELSLLKLATTSSIAILKLKSEGINGEHFWFRRAGKKNSATRWIYEKAVQYFDKSGGMLLTPNVLESTLEGDGYHDEAKISMLGMWSQIQDQYVDENELYFLTEELKVRLFQSKWEKCMDTSTRKMRDVSPMEGVEELKRQAFLLERIIKGKQDEDALVFNKMSDWFEKDMRSRMRDPESLGVKIGMSEIDKVTFGFFPEELVVFVAPSSGGKSVALLNCAHYAFHVEGANVLYFSLELGRRKTVYRHLALMYGLDHDKLRAANFTDEELDTLVANTRNMGGDNYFIYDYRSKQVTAEYIDIRIQEVTAEYGKPDVVVIDYIGIMTSNQTPKSAPSHMRVGDVAEEVVELGKKYGLTTWTAAQFNRSGMGERRAAKAAGKAFEFAQDMVSGDSRLVHYASAVIGMDPNREEGTTAFHGVKMRDANFAPFFMRADPRHMKLLEVCEEDQEEWRQLNGVKGFASKAAGIYQKEEPVEETAQGRQGSNGKVSVKYGGGIDEFAPQDNEVVAGQDLWQDWGGV